MMILNEILNNGVSFFVGKTDSTVEEKGGHMLSVDTIARVVVTTSRGTETGSAFDTGLLLVEDDGFMAERRVRVFHSAEEACARLVLDGFEDDSAAVGCVQKYFGVSPAPNKIMISCYPDSETPAAALAAVVNRTADFYGVAVADAMTKAEALALAEYASGASVPMVVFLPVTGTPAAVVTDGELLSSLKAGDYARALSLYCYDTSDAAALMGLAMGLTLSHPNSAFALCYKTIDGVTPSDLTEAQATAIKALNGNVYVTRGYTHRLLELGAVASGMRYDEVMYIDMISVELQNAAVALLAENTDRMPQTDDASAQFINRFAGILAGYSAMGVLASAAWKGVDAGPLHTGDMVENGFALWADSYDLQSEEDREAHKAMPIHVALTLAGSLESVVIAVNVQI